MLIFVFYVSLAFFLSLLAVKPLSHGLSVVLGTTVTVENFSTGQLAISLIAICMLVYLELSDPSYGKTRRLIEELRNSWLPLTVLLVMLFALVVFFKVWAIMHACI